MSHKVSGPEIEHVVQLLARLPGLGPRSARKAALALLKKRNELLLPLSQALALAIEKIVSARFAAVLIRFRLAVFAKTRAATVR